MTKLSETAKLRRRRRKERQGKKPEGSDSGDVTFGKTWKTVPESQRDPNRFFNWFQKGKIWERQAGRCARSGKPLNSRTVEFDHIIPWAAGGRTIIDNGEALTPEAHRKKTRKQKFKRGWG